MNADETQRLLRLAAHIIGAISTVRSELVTIWAIFSDEIGGELCCAIAAWALRNRAALR